MDASHPRRPDCTTVGAPCSVLEGSGRSPGAGLYGKKLKLQIQLGLALDSAGPLVGSPLHVSNTLRRCLDLELGGFVADRSILSAVCPCIDPEPPAFDRAMAFCYPASTGWPRQRMYICLGLFSVLDCDSQHTLHGRAPVALTQPFPLHEQQLGPVVEHRELLIGKSEISDTYEFA